MNQRMKAYEAKMALVELRGTLDEAHLKELEWAIEIIEKDEQKQEGII